MRFFSRMFLGDDATVAAVALMVTMIDNAPDDWELDRFRLQHTSGRLSVWIANSVYGLHIEVSGSKIKPRWLLRRRLYAIYRRYAAKQAADEMTAAFGKFRSNVHSIAGRAA